jgi:hypothetical protein
VRLVARRAHVAHARLRINPRLRAARHDRLRRVPPEAPQRYCCRPYSLTEVLSVLSVTPLCPTISCGPVFDARVGRFNAALMPFV